MSLLMMKVISMTIPQVKNEREEKHYFIGFKLRSVVRKTTNICPALIFFQRVRFFQLPNIKLWFTSRTL